jgi:hypothetical protein
VKSGLRVLTGPWAVRAAILRELAALTSSAVAYPFGLTSATSGGLVRLPVTAYSTSSISTPIVLVHGYGGNRSNSLTLQLALNRAGFHNLHAMLYNPLTETTPRIAARLVRDCHAAMRASGFNRVHVVAHSYGGIVLRYAVARLGLGRWVHTAVTVATPHSGAPVARLGRGSVAADLRPGSELMRMLAATAHPGCLRWVSYWSNRDLIAPPSSAILRLPAPEVVNVAVPEEGHVSILRSPVLSSDLVARLLAAESDAGWDRETTSPDDDLGLNSPLVA